MPLNDELFPKTTFFGEKEKAKTRQMASDIPDVSSFNTRKRLNPDGSETILRTKGGMPRVTRSPVPEIYEAPVTLATVRLLSDYFTQGFEYDSSVSEISSDEYLWPALGSNKYCSISIPDRGSAKVKQLAARKNHPGSTTWEDTRTPKVVKEVLSWEAPFGGRCVANGRNYGALSVGSLIFNQRFWQDPDYLDPPLMTVPLTGDGFDVYVGQGFPGAPYTGQVSGTAYILGWQFSALASTPRRSYGSMLPVVGDSFVQATWLYENGLRLFSVDGLLSAAKVSEDRYRCITAYMSINVQHGRVGTADSNPVPPSIYMFKIIDFSGDGTVLNELEFTFPEDVYWIYQIPLINSSATKAVGIFYTDATGDQRTPSNVYEIDLLDGSVSSILETTGSYSPMAGGTTGTSTITYSGVVACDYRGDDLVSVICSGTETSTRSFSDGDITDVETTSGSITRTFAFPEFSRTDAQSISGSFTEERNSEAWRLYQSTVISFSTVAAAPIYVDLRHGIYVISELSGNGDSTKIHSEDYSYNYANSVSGGYDQSAKLKIMFGDTLKHEAVTYEVIRTGIEAAGYNFFPEYCVSYLSAFSRDGEIILSFLGSGISAWATGEGSIPVGSMYHGALVVNNSVHQVILDNKLDYHGDIKWFSEPYLGPIPTSDPKELLT